VVRTRGADRFSTELTIAMGPTDLTASVLTTSGSPASPCYLVIDHDVPARAEIILFDGAFTGTTFVTTALANRYLQGSAAGSGITHPIAAKVIFAMLGSHHEEMWVDVEEHATATAVHSATSAATANRIAIRDSAGRMKATSPATSTDVATKGYVDGVIPVGGIILWSGSVASIPAGWQLCNGTNGTPDLRDRFVVGAGSTYNPGNTGGSTTHRHDISVSAAHSHSGGDTSNRGIAGGGATVMAHPLPSQPGHDHGGNTANQTALPPYYALAYIQRVS
jgi:hypothetical protein